MQNLSQMAPLHFSTLLARKPSQIRSYIKEISQSFSKKGHTVFFALSSDFQWPEGLQDVVHDLRGLASGLDGKGRLVGCLSGPVSEVSLPLKSGGAELSCAIAIFDSAQCVPFYSSLSGRKEVQVGRWHSFRGKEDIQEGIGGLEVDNGTDVNWEDIWSRKHSKTSAELLPKELLSIPTSKTHSLVYVSVPKPDLFTAALSNHFSPSTTFLGLVAAPTHFITNRPVTLFFDDRIYGDGSVGLALVEKDKKRQVLELETEFVGSQKLGKIMRITRTEGNVVNALDDLNPTKLLLAAIDQAGISSPLDPSRMSGEDDTFGLAVVSSTGKILRAYKITAGDPTHRGGSISLEESQTPGSGTLVQLIHRSPRTPLPLPASLTSSSTPTNPSMSFLTVSDPPSRTLSTLASESSLLLRNTFLATSGSGFMLSRGARSDTGVIQGPNGSKTNIGPEAPWSCTIPGAMARFRWA